MVVVSPVFSGVSAVLLWVFSLGEVLVSDEQVTLRSTGLVTEEAREVVETGAGVA